MYSYKHVHGTCVEAAYDKSRRDRTRWRMREGVGWREKENKRQRETDKTWCLKKMSVITVVKACSFID